MTIAYVETGFDCGALVYELRSGGQRVGVEVEIDFAELEAFRLLGQMLELRARRRTGTAIRELLSLGAGTGRPGTSVTPWEALGTSRAICSIIPTRSLPSTDP